MDFADEHYLKYFPRKTVTRARWPWQAEALLAPLMGELNKAGIVDVDPRFGVAESVAALLGKWPTEVVRVGLDAYLADGTFELVGSRLVMPKFLEAQESRKTDAAKARDYREKKRDLARANTLGLLEPTVTPRHTASQPVTPSDPPSPALPVPDPELLPRESRAGNPPAKPPEKPPDPRHAPLVKALTIAYHRKRDEAYPFEPRDAKRVQALLARKPADTAPDLWPVKLLAAWERALDSQFPGCSTLDEFGRQLAKHLGTGPPTGSAGRAQSFVGAGPLTATEGTL